MWKNRRTEIAIELDQVITITRRPPAVLDWCSACGANVVRVSLEEGSSLTSIGTLAIVRIVEAHQVHFTETKAGRMGLCLPSLLQAAAAAECAWSDETAR